MGRDIHSFADLDEVTMTFEHPLRAALEKAYI